MTIQAHSCDEEEARRPAPVADLVSGYNDESTTSRGRFMRIIIRTWCENGVNTGDHVVRGKIIEQR